MRYEVVDNEIQLLGADGKLSRLSASQLWSNENDQDSSLRLSDNGLWFDELYASLTVHLEESQSGSFGVIRIYATDTDGNVACLSPDHRSDHVIIGDAVVPLQAYELEEITKHLEKINAKAGQDLSFASYLLCIKDLEDDLWCVQDWTFEAKRWSESATCGSIDSAPKCFRAKLEDYQTRGSNWLTMMINQGAGSILGDGMGLGKTVQMIKAICDLVDKDPAAQVLIVCPGALVENWKREISKFTLGFDVLLHVGPNRSRNYHDFVETIVITTYDVVRSDEPVLTQICWDLLILDEAQFIKNPGSKRTQCVKKISHRVGIAMTGTPFENHVTDVWSLMDFCCPGFLGSAASFTSRFKDEELSASRLGEIVAPFMLRRKLSDIPNNLPPLIKIPMPIALLDEEAYEYDRRRLEYKKNGATLGVINKLINDLGSPKESQGYISALKFEYLQSVLEQVTGNEEKIIVFVNRNLTSDYLLNMYSKEIPTFTLNGQTPACDRLPIIDEFSETNGSAMLLCNPTVGGAGLNITAANHVFHFSPQWNPAIIDQSDARSHRRGQEQTVFSHYPYYASTIEEYMWEKITKKRELSALATTGNKGMTANEIEEALNLSPVDGRSRFDY